MTVHLLSTMLKLLHTIRGKVDTFLYCQYSQNCNAGKKWKKEAHLMCLLNFRSVPEVIIT